MRLGSRQQKRANDNASRSGNATYVRTRVRTHLGSYIRTQICVKAFRADYWSCGSRSK